MEWAKHDEGDDHERTMHWAAKQEEERAKNVDDQEKSDAWRGKGINTPWGAQP